MPGTTKKQHNIKFKMAAKGLPQNHTATGGNNNANK
jgi:hypothetical protein